MQYLSTTPSCAGDLGLHPQLMLQLYRAALECCTNRRGTQPSGGGGGWFQQVFAPPDVPSILVRCLGGGDCSTSPKRPRPTNTAQTAPCPICSRQPAEDSIDVALVDAGSRKRQHQSSRMDSGRPFTSVVDDCVFHLVPCKDVCWTHPTMQQAEPLDDAADRDDDDDTMEDFLDQCIYPTADSLHSEHAPLDRFGCHDRVFALDTLYDSECRSLFINRLGVSLSNVLCVLSFLVSPLLTAVVFMNYNDSSQYCIYAATCIVSNQHTALIFRGI